MATFFLSSVAISLNIASFWLTCLQDEAAKAEQDEDVAFKDQGADVTEDHSALKSNETDDNDEILSSYRSAF